MGGIERRNPAVAVARRGAEDPGTRADDDRIPVELGEAAGGGHRLVEADADLPGYAESGLPLRTMGRTLDEDRLFFAAPLAAGTALAAATR